MKITDGGGVKPPDVQRNDYSPEKSKGKIERGDALSDRVVLSERAREIRRLQLEVTKIPDIRPDRVERVMNAIQNGTYRIRYEVLAEKLMDDTFRFSWRA